MAMPRWVRPIPFGSDERGLPVDHPYSEAVVDCPVVRPAQKDQVRELRVPGIGPVLDVVDVAPGARVRHRYDIRHASEVFWTSPAPVRD
jgi:hypothetical protein